MNRSFRVSILSVSLLIASVCGASGRADDWQKLRENGAEVYYADAELRAAFEKANPDALPKFRRNVPDATATAFDWTAIVKPAHVLDQKKSICCWAYAGLTAFEYSWSIRNGDSPPPLALQPILDRVGKDGSGYAGWALRDLLEHGTCTAGAYPHVGKPSRLRENIKMPYRAIAWGLVAPQGGMPSVQELKQALVDHGPLESCVYATKAFIAYKGGVYREASHLPDKPVSTHMVVIVGWDDRRGTQGSWKVQSSWGKRWGEGGFMWLEYESNRIGHSACRVRAQAKQYRLPDGINREVNDVADPFPVWKGAQTVSLPSPKSLPALTPAEALKHEGERVVVEFEVRGGEITPAGHVELFTENSWRDDGCLLIRLLKRQLPKFANGNGQAILETYRGKKIRVRGSLQRNALYVGGKLLGDRPVIEVADPGQIEFVETVVTPAEALKHEGERIVLECLAQNGGTTPDGHVELNTEKNWRDEGCILIRVPKSELPKFGRGSRAVLDRYGGLKIRVRGLLRRNELYVDGRLLGDRPVVEVSEPGQIEIVNSASAGEPSDVLTPADALKHEGERIVLEFVVQNGNTTPDGHVELDTKQSWRDDGCILIRLLKSELHKFGNGNDRAVLTMYRGKKIRVRGWLRNNLVYVGGRPLGDRPVIEVTGPEQIEIVN